LHRLLLSFPTRRSSDLSSPREFKDYPDGSLAEVRLCCAEQHEGMPGQRVRTRQKATKSAPACNGNGGVSYDPKPDKVIAACCGRSEEHTSELQSRSDLV